tara:strand:+ start:600 stop:2477 length:1878 start_codon:yes stop_codon:yes gene_type:complete
MDSQSNTEFGTPMSSCPASPKSIRYSETDIDRLGLKFTMDGGADGHDIYSSIDEILHNLIDLMTENISINFIPDKFWSFEFNITGNIENPKDKLENGVRLFGTKGNVGNNDISKFGKGIKCSAHCIFPDGKMILGLIINKKLHMAVYNQGTVQSIYPDTEESSLIEKYYTENVKIDFSFDSGFLILCNYKSDDYEYIFQEYQSFKGSDLEYDEEEKKTISNIKNHISICYSPYLDSNFIEPSEIDGCERTIKVYLCDEQINSFSHTKFSEDDIKDNAELDYSKEYEVRVPFRKIEGKTIYDFSNIYFKDESYQEMTFDLNDKGKIAIVPNLEEIGIEPCNYNSATIRITKLSTEAQGHYIKTYPNYEKTKSCSYFVYRNGVCSNTSFIPFEGDCGAAGLRPTDCPQLRAEIHFNNSFDPVINPGSNKSIIRPNEIFKQKIRALAKHVHKNVFKKIDKPQKSRIEGNDYLVTSNNSILSIGTGKKLGEIKGGIARWDKLKGIKAKGKKELMEKSKNMTPILSETIDKHTDIKDKKDANFRLFTPNPESSEDDIRIISNREHAMIQNDVIQSDVLEDEVKLKDKQIDILKGELNDILRRINQNYTIVDYRNNSVLDLSHITLDAKPC